MAQKKGSKKKVSKPKKKVSKAKKKSPARKIRLKRKRIKLDNKRKFNFSWKALLVSFLLAVLFYILYSIPTAPFFSSLFGVLLFLFSILALTFFILFLIFLFMKAFSK